MYDEQNKNKLKQQPTFLQMELSLQIIGSHVLKINEYFYEM